MKSRSQRLVAPLLSAAIGVVLGANAASASPDRASLSAERLESIMLSAPREVANANLVTESAQGPVQIIARLRSPAVGEGRGSTKSQLIAEQAAFVARIQSAMPEVQVLSSTQLVLNAVFLEADAAQVAAISRDVAVARVAEVGDYHTDLATTVPYVGAAALQGLGVTGAGVRVAVIDSGVDYTHANLGGAGTLAAYEAAYGTSAGHPANTTTDGLFPTAKVVGGMDFVGELWPNGLRTEDPDPIPGPDLTTFGGHGSHVAHIIGGNTGVAPGVSLYAYKACATPTPNCNGIALIRSMEFSVDPNQDGNTSDAVDIINMSLGSNYAQPFDDDLSTAVDNATTLGVLTVAAAGNGSDKPYVQGSPAGAKTAISVAQTHVPLSNAQLMTIVSPPVTPANRGAVFQTWSGALAATIEGAVLYPAGANALGCNPFAAGSLAGRVVMVDRGVCNASVKIQNIQAAGGILGIIGFVDGNAPFAFAFGGGVPPTIPAFAINLADANAIRGGQTVRFDPNNRFALVGSMVATSSRGPQYEDHRIKPDVGAPGQSVSAQSGTGNGTAAFGGTSGATPMVAGAAAQLLHLDPTLTPDRVKQLLINNADNTTTAPATVASVIPNQLAPVSRIGGGELRVDRAALAEISVYPIDPEIGAVRSGGLGLGFVDVSTDTVTISRQIVIVDNCINANCNKSKTVTITPVMRYANDAATNAVSVSVPSSINLGPHATRVVNVRFTINGNNLRNNLMSAGLGGGQFAGGGDDPVPLTLNEYDGYLQFTGSGQSFSLPWHVLPRKAADVRTPGGRRLQFDPGTGLASVTLRNRGVGAAQNDAYALLAVSPDIPSGDRGAQAPTPDIRAFGVNTFSVPTGVCSSGFLWAFAINTHERQATPIGVSHQVSLDTDRNGTTDFIVLNRDFSFNNVTDGRILTWIFNPTLQVANAFFGAEHSTNTGNTVLYLCTNHVGITGPQVLAGRLVNASLLAQDFYFGGPGDTVGPFTIAPFFERYLGLPDDVAAKSDGSMVVVDFGQFPGTTGETGILLITNGDRGAASRGGATQATEAITFGPPGAIIDP